MLQFWRKKLVNGGEGVYNEKGKNFLKGRWGTIKARNLSRKLLLLASLLFWAAAITAWGEEELPPLWEEESLQSSLPEEEQPPPEEEESWQDWEENWSSSWNGADSASGWEFWEEEAQDSPPQWGPALAVPEEEPAFPEEEPVISEEPPPAASVPPVSSSKSPASSKSPKKAASSRETVELPEEEVPEADPPGILPRRVTEADLPPEDTPLWHRAADPNILWILLVAVSLVVLGLRILWQEDGRGRKSQEQPDTRKPSREKWGI